MRALVSLLAAVPASLAAQSVTGRVVDSATHRPLAHVTVQLVPGTDSVRDTVFAAGETVNDGAFLLMAPGPGTYRVRIGARQIGPPLVLATVDAEDAHEYRVGAALPVSAPAADTGYHVLHGAELDAMLRSGRPLVTCQVERPASIVRGTMNVEYPTMLKRTESSGSLIAQFVIDTTGRADLSTLSVWAPPNTAPEFGASVRAGIARARFTPGQSDGRTVRQLVQLPMTFQLTGRGAPPPLPKTACAPLGGEPR